ncbi:MAG: hypothetical protein AAGF95_10100 [Chloroflexota bacterium]
MSGTAHPKKWFLATSRVVDILVQLGSRVTEVQSLVRLDTRDLELAVESARVSLAQAQSELDSLTEGPTDEELAQARQSLTSAQSSVVQTQQSITVLPMWWYSRHPCGSSRYCLDQKPRNYFGRNHYHLECFAHSCTDCNQFFNHNWHYLWSVPCTTSSSHDPD